MNQGSTGVVVSAACNGPCGQPPFAPLDVVVVIDRTSSMAGDENNLRDAASSVLTSYDPNVQHVALGMLGPSTMTQSCSGSPGNVKGIPLGVGASGIQLQGGSTGETNEAEANISIDRPNGNTSGDVMLAQITFDDGSSVPTINVPNGWALVRRTDNGTHLGQAIYYKVATGSEPNSYTWGFQTGGGADYPTEAAGGIITYSGVSTSSPFDPVASSPNIGTGATGNSATLTATEVDPNTSPTQVVAFFGHEDDASISQPSGMTEQYENRVDNTGQDLTISADDDTQTNANATGDKGANAGSSAAWVANLVALRSRGSEYGTDTVADLSKWMIVGLTGTGGGQQVNEAYATNGILNDSSQLAKAIDCFQLSSTGTNLATPMRMAHAYLEAYGRPGVKQGIIFESDGTPNYNGNSGDANNYTCGEALDAAADAKAAGIEIFTIGFDVVGQNCPDRSKTATVALAEMATGSILGGTSCGSNGDENRDGDHFFCEPAGSDLSAVFQAAAVQLAGIRCPPGQGLPGAVRHERLAERRTSRWQQHGDDQRQRVHRRDGGDLRRRERNERDGRQRLDGDAARPGRVIRPDRRRARLLAGRHIADRDGRRVHVQLTPRPGATATTGEPGQADGTTAAVRGTTVISDISSGASEPSDSATTTASSFGSSTNPVSGLTNACPPRLIDSSVARWSVRRRAATSSIDSPM